MSKLGDVLSWLYLLIFGVETLEMGEEENLSENAVHVENMVKN